MKRAPQDRETLARREAAHLLVAVHSQLFTPTRTIWHQLSRYEILHTDVQNSQTLEWEDPASRNALIADRTALALSGGAAVWPRGQPCSGIEEIFEATGKTDFELAHEWLALQRYDPSQAQIESEIRTIFQKLVNIFSSESAEGKLASIQARILKWLSRAEKADLKNLESNSEGLIADTPADLDMSFELHFTLRQAS
ncbi:hypothetical protein OA90_10460 [Labrenzia sp. OB1]|nr:hypothetical protein OA90_10460 [Labrenzia sp. OB1]